MSGHDRCDKAIALTGNPNSGYFRILKTALQNRETPIMGRHFIHSA
jgi:hypothetical protein